MLRRAGLACVLALCVAARAAPQTSSPPPPGDLFEYGFASEKELDDFEPIAGTWTVSAGSLWCTSKGAREELRWRRELSPSGSLAIRLHGGSVLTLVLRAGDAETTLLLDRADARLAVHAGGRRQLELPFEAPASGLLDFAVVWSPERVDVQVGADEPVRVKRPEAAPFDRLSLVSIRSQPRIDELLIARDQAPPPAAEKAGAAPLPESLRVAIENATKLLDEGDADAAFAQLVASLPRAEEGAPPAVPDLARALLQRLALAERRLRHAPPLEALIDAARLPAKDGSATLVLPLRSGWTGAAKEVRRADGTLFELVCDSPRVAVEIYRYDQKLPYFFGRDPRLVYTSGGGGATLGRARADDQKDQHAEARFTRELERAPFELSGERCHEYELVWPDPEAAGTTRALRELFVLHRGDTWRISIGATAADLEFVRPDLDWLLAGFEFTKR